MRWLVILVLLIAPPAFGQEVVEGPATAIDGDTIDVRGVRVRLWAIDAPELAVWPWGPWSQRKMETLLFDRPVRCVISGKSYKRLVGRCFDGAGGDIGVAMLRAGLAVVSRHFVAQGAQAVQTLYRAAEIDAVTGKRGIWRDFAP